MNFNCILLTIILLSIFLFVNGVPWNSNRQENIFINHENNNLLKNGNLQNLMNEKINNNDKLEIKKIPLELKDLKESFVHPKDDDDEDDDVDDDFNTTVSSKLLMDIKNLNNDTLPPKLFPTDPLIVKSIINYSPELREKLNHEYNVTDFGDKIKQTDVKGLANSIEQTTLRISTRRKPSTDDKILKITETREQMILNNENTDKLINKKTTHPGIIALLVAILFAIVSSFGYVGLMMWKKYLEYKHGNRELLVNDFDSNDINNFEL